MKTTIALTILIAAAAFGQNAPANHSNDNKAPAAAPGDGGEIEKLTT